MSLTIPAQMYANGFTDLVSIIPPQAQLQPSSTIPIHAIGKIPGRRGRNGLWGGYNWRMHAASAVDVVQWAQDGANFGLRADHFPCVDIDCVDPGLAAVIQDAAFAFLGRAPIRIGLPPKRLLMYRTAEPFGRMRMWVEKDGAHHLIEILGAGQQYVVHGIHPKTLAPYTWDGDLGAVKPSDLVNITREKAEAFFQYLTGVLEMLSVGKVEREGDGKLSGDAAPDQDELKAPSLELLRQAVRLIPNNNELFPDRTSYLRIGYAIRSAGAADLEEAYAIFSEWATKWEGNGRNAGNDPDIVYADWRRMRGPYAVGWHFLAEQARAFGFDTAALEFERIDAVVPDNVVPTAPRLSDQWLADIIATRQRGILRYVPQRQYWIVWNAARWQPDAELLAEDIIKRELRAIANDEMRRGATDKEKRDAYESAKAICSSGKVAAVAALIKSDRSIAVSVEALDHDHWLLNTPGGVVDLRTGDITVASPDTLCTKSSAVAPAHGGAHPEWTRFLREATGEDASTISYLQRLCGYALTGDTREQHLTFIFGTGGNGKGTFLNALSGILGDYAAVAAMDTFTASYGDKHSTDVASLAGARLVTASETEAGKRWDETKVKSLTGGDPIKARFMRQDNFTFIPQFKLVFIGNHKPEIRTVDDAMRRRIQMVGFTHTPAKIDKQLNVKLREEWPAILRWMIDGCLAWQKEGLAPPPSVLETTEEYFSDEDALDRWIKECCDTDGEATESLQALYLSWREWTNGNGEHTGSLRRLSAALASRKYQRIKDVKTRRASLVGLRIIRQDVLGILT